MNIKSELHPRNKHREDYDLEFLIQSCSELAPFVILNKYQVKSVDFFNPEAVKMLNKALLKAYYQIDHWDIPAGYLCPPVPGRADYIHHIADLLGESNRLNIPLGNKVKGLDIGVGANCIYPIIAFSEYQWQFVGSDIDQKAIDSSNKIILSNPKLRDKISIRLQSNSKDIFKSIIRENELFDFTICNPPFHSSKAEARSSANRKLKNLKAKKRVLNFAGQSNELWYDGGEYGFLKEMIGQSKEFTNSVMWFTCLVSKESNLKKVYVLLNNVNAKKVKTIPMETGNKKSRIVAWSFLNEKEIKEWGSARWT